MVTAEELGNQPLLVSAVSFGAAVLSDPEGPYDDLTILMGHTDLESLTETFADNWSSSGGQVFFDSSHIITDVVPGSYFTFQLDTPFVYNGSENLLIEVTWDGPAEPPLGQGSIYTWYWTTTGNRVLSSNDLSSATGSAFEYCNNLRIDYSTEAFESATFAGIKASF